MNCKGICSNFLAKNLDLKIYGRYKSGHKRCSFCEVYIIWSGDRCPCCKIILRLKPRNTKARRTVLIPKSKKLFF